MQEVSTTITISVEEYKKMLLDAHDALRYVTENYRLKQEIEELRGNVAHYERALTNNVDHS